MFVCEEERREQEYVGKSCAQGRMLTMLGWLSNRMFRGAKLFQYDEVVVVIQDVESQQNKPCCTVVERMGISDVANNRRSVTIHNERLRA